MPLGSKPVKPLMVVSVIIMPGRIDAEIVAGVDQAGHAVHDDAVALGRRDIEDDVPAFARRVAGPVVVRDHHAPVFGITAGGDEGAAMVARTRAAARRARRSCRATCRSREVPARRSAPRCPRYPASRPSPSALRRCRSVRRDTPAPRAARTPAPRALRKNSQSFFSSCTISAEIALKVSLISAASR